ncbi:AAPC-like protein [Mya arenaria]|uniref:glucose-6-phosphate 1-epimerase n=1 Tax=Mya arenaria TaxID=6604 RepID=A0ABY7E1G3_MYAAR|nr:AAPC-like protein [Mya arenaria]
MGFDSDAKKSHVRYLVLLPNSYSSHSGGSSYRDKSATVTSWKHEGEEFLFCSKKAVLDGSKAIRGGIPIQTLDPGSWVPSMGLPESRSGNRPPTPGMVKMGLSVWTSPWKMMIRQDKCGTRRGEEFDFTTLLHTYVRVEDIMTTTITGLQNCTYTDKVHVGEHVEEREAVVIDENYDRIYQAVDGAVNVNQDMQTLGTLRIERDNLPDVVVWNPWQEKAAAMSDLVPMEYLEMVCVEAGAVTSRVVLPPAQQRTFSQKLIICRGQQVIL